MFGAAPDGVLAVGQLQHRARGGRLSGISLRGGDFSWPVTAVVGDRMRLQRRPRDWCRRRPPAPAWQCRRKTRILLMDDEPVTLKTSFQLCLVAAVANLTLLAATLPVAG